MDPKAVLADVRANRKRLDECEGPHEFDKALRSIGELVTDWTCSRCGGHVDQTKKHWYERGLEHGRGLPS